MLGQVKTGQPAGRSRAPRGARGPRRPPHVRMPGEDLAQRRVIGGRQADRVPGRDADQQRRMVHGETVGVSRSSARRASIQARRSAPRRPSTRPGSVVSARRGAAGRTAPCSGSRRRPPRPGKLARRLRGRRGCRRGRGPASPARTSSSRTRSYSCARPCSVRSPLTRTAPGAGMAATRAPRRRTSARAPRRRRDVRVAQLDEEERLAGAHAVVVSGRWRPTWPT